MSRFLDLIDHDLREAVGSLRIGELEAKRAGYLARVGRFEEAREVVLRLRSSFGDGHSGSVTVWIMLAEAMIGHFESLDLVALDRSKRAQFLSTLMRDSDLISYSSAWKAHFEFEHSKFEEAFESLALALAKARPANWGANSRISNIVSKAALLCGRFELEQKHFKSGRESALMEGDQAGIEALQHNRATFRLAWVRCQMALGVRDERQISQARTDLSSAQSLQNLTGIQALGSYVSLARARALVVDRKFEEAAKAIESIRAQGPFPRGSFSQPLLDLELAYCNSQLNDSASALKHFQDSRTIDLNSLDADERLVAAWLELELNRREPNLGNFESAEARFEEAASGYREFVDLIGAKLDQLAI